MKRVLIAIMCLAAAGGFGYSAFSGRWLENKTGAAHVSFSLLSSKRCLDGVCESKSNNQLMAELALDPKEQASTAFATAGQATFGLSLLSALLLFICAVYLASNKRTKGPNGPQHLALIAITLVIIAATVFIKLKPGGATGVGASLGFWVFGGGCMLGLFGGQFASKLIKPIESEPEF